LNYNFLGIQVLFANGIFPEKETVFYEDTQLLG
jgi:hypothetical protein